MLAKSKRQMLFVLILADFLRSYRIFVPVQAIMHKKEKINIPICIWCNLFCVKKLAYWCMMVLMCLETIVCSVVKPTCLIQCMLSPSYAVKNVQHSTFSNSVPTLRDQRLETDSSYNSVYLQSLFSFSPENKQKNK